MKTQTLFFLAVFSCRLVYATPPEASETDFKTLPQVQWKFALDAPVFSSPVADGEAVYFGALNGTLYSLDRGSGKENWTFKTTGEIRGNVCLGENGSLFLIGGDGHLYSLSKDSGKIDWKFETGGEKKYDFADYYQSTPVLKEGILYFGSGDGNVYALDASSGVLKWKFGTSGVVHTTPAVAAGRLVVGSHDGYVYALNISDGSLIWKFKTVGQMYFPKGEVQGHPAVSANLTFVGARDYNLYALDLEKGYAHWNKKFERGWALVNVVHDSVLYTGTSDDRLLIAYDMKTGREKWSTNVGYNIFGNPGFSQSMTYTGTSMGKVHGIDLATGAIQWTFTTDGYRQNRLKYFREDDSYRDDIYEIIKSNEQLVDVVCELGGIFSTPAISGSLMFITSTEGSVYCLKRE